MNSPMRDFVENTFVPVFAQTTPERRVKELTAHLAQAREEIEELRAILEDIAAGARVMLGSPIVKALHPYAAEVLRVATSAARSEASHG